MLIPCDCGSRKFKVDATYTAVDDIELKDDGSEDFDVLDTDYGDGEWDDMATVRCAECGKEWEYQDWSKREAPAEGATDMKLTGKLLVIDPITDATETAASALVRNMATGEQRTITDAALIRALYDDPTAKSYGEGSYTVEIEAVCR